MTDIPIGHLVWIRLKNKNKKGYTRLLGHTSASFSWDTSKFLPFVEVGNAKTQWFNIDRVDSIELLGEVEAAEIVLKSTNSDIAKYKDYFLRGES